MKLQIPFVVNPLPAHQIIQFRIWISVHSKVRKESRLLRPNPLHIYLEHKTNYIPGAEQLTTLWTHGSVCWQPSRDRNWHGSDMSGMMTAFPKPSFKPPGRVGGAVVEMLDGLSQRVNFQLLMPELLMMVSHRKYWKIISAQTFLMPPRRSNRSRDWLKTEQNS